MGIGGRPRSSWQCPRRSGCGRTGLLGGAAVSARPADRTGYYSLNDSVSGNSSRSGQVGHSASITCIRSSSASNGSRMSDGGELMPPSPDNGCRPPSLELTENLLEQRLTAEELEILPNLSHIQRVPVCTDQGSDVFDVLCAPGVV